MASPSTQTGDRDLDFKIEAQLMRHSETLYAYVQRKIPAGLRGTISPEDILQEVWMVAANKINGIQRSDEVAAWLMNATKNKLADAIKRALAIKRGGREQFEYAVRPASSSGLGPLELAESGQRTASSEDAAREAASAVRSAVGFLPAQYREAVAMRYLDEESVPVIARRMQSTVPATRGLLYRGIRMLREHLGPAWRYFSDERSVDTDLGARQDGE
jgi:RNA polymerase sigma-70 factor, ECF subfamily